MSAFYMRENEAFAEITGIKVNTDFGLLRPAGPSSGAACLLLVSSRLDCPGMSLAEVCALSGDVNVVIQWWCDFEVL